MPAAVLRKHPVPYQIVPTTGKYTAIKFHVKISQSVMLSSPTQSVSPRWLKTVSLHH